MKVYAGTFFNLVCKILNAELLLLEFLSIIFPYYQSTFQAEGFLNEDAVQRTFRK